MSKWIAERTRNQLPKQSFLLGLSSLVAAPAFAHHGWRWMQDGTFELRGVIRPAEPNSVDQGILVDADGEVWHAEFDKHLDRKKHSAALKLLTAGKEVTFLGTSSNENSHRFMTVEQLVIRGKTYDLRGQ